MAEYGVIADDEFIFLNWRVEKPDGQGGWEWATDWPPPHSDPPGYSVLFAPTTTDFATDPSLLDTSGLGPGPFTGDQGGDTLWLSELVGWTGTFPEQRFTRLRMSAVADCSSGEHDAKNYRFHATVYVPDLCVWDSGEIPIPSGPTAVTDEVANPSPIENVFYSPDPIVLPDHGTTAYGHDWCAVALIKRNGKVIRCEDARQSSDGDPFDHPTYPITIQARAASRDRVWSDAQNGVTTFGRQYGSWLGDPGGENTAPKTAGSWAVNEITACPDRVSDRIKLVVWREGAPPTEYVPAKGAAPIPVTPAAFDNCTVQFKFFKAASFLRGVYPFLYNGNIANPVTLPPAPTSALGADFYPATPPGLYKMGEGIGYSSGGSLPREVAFIADLLPRTTTADRAWMQAPAWAGRLIRVKDPGVAEDVQVLRETAVDGVYEWVSLVEGGGGGEVTATQVIIGGIPVIVKAANQTEEDAAYAAGAWIVIRTDLP